MAKKLQINSGNPRKSLEGKIVPRVPLRHEAKQTQPFGISKI